MNYHITLKKDHGRVWGVAITPYILTLEIKGVTEVEQLQRLSHRQNIVRQRSTKTLTILGAGTALKLPFEVTHPQQMKASRRYVHHEIAVRSAQRIAIMLSGKNIPLYHPENRDSFEEHLIL